MLWLYVTMVIAAYILLLFWIVIAVQETTRKYVPESRHISIKKGKTRYVVKRE